MSETGLNFVEKDERIVFNIKVAAGNSKTELTGIYNGMLKVKISAAPEKGKANQALIKLLSEKFDVPKNQIAILSGLTSKIKQISIQNLSAEAVNTVLSKCK